MRKRFGILALLGIVSGTGYAVLRLRKSNNVLETIKSRYDDFINTITEQLTNKGD